MCNINLIRMDNPKRILSMMDILTHHSNTSNPDGEGAMFLKNGEPLFILKTLEKIYYYEYHAIKADFIISHQRLATTGTKKQKNCHPFISKNWILFHNGVFINKGRNLINIGEDKTDSEIFLNEMESLQSPKLNKNPAFWIKKGIEKYAEGSYSLLFFYKPSKRLFYIKNRSTQFHYFISGSDMVCSTSKNNVMYFAQYIKRLKKDKQKKQIYTPESNTIYEINKCDWVKIYKVKEISPPYQYNLYKDYPQQYWDNNKHLEYQNYWDEESKTKPTNSNYWY